MVCGKKERGGKKIRSSLLLSPLSLIRRCDSSQWIARSIWLDEKGTKNDQRYHQTHSRIPFIGQNNPQR